MKRLTDKLFGELNMSWLTVILFAVAAAVVTTVFLAVPVFKDTSFERMGVTLEAWIFFAVIIMANCRKPLESALKTFVFFLVSQPLIYLFQVPFSSLGFGLFGYYRYWFILTLLTFPAAFVGWYITKKNWLSLLILFPVLVFLTDTYVSSFRFAFRHFPCLLVTAVFCLLQVILYLYVFTSNLWQKLIGFLVPLIGIFIFLMVRPQLDINGTNFLPDDPVLSESAVIVTEEGGIAKISIERTGEDSMIRVRSKKYGTMDFSIQDGDTEYNYTLEIYEDSGGHPQVGITVR